MLDPETSWGVALLFAEDESQADAIKRGDPAFAAGMHIEIYPMGALVHK